MPHRYILTGAPGAGKTALSAASNPSATKSSTKQRPMSLS